MMQNNGDPFGRLMEAVHLVEAGEYSDSFLHDLKERTDDIGKLARMLDVMAQQVASRNQQLWMLRKVIPVGVSLSAEKNFDRLLETVVVEAQALTNADGGTLYLLEDEKSLKFVIMRNTSLGIAMGGTSNNKISFDFDFSGTKSFDARTGYRSKSFLTIPLKNTQGRVIGVLQLINAKDAQTGETIPFGTEDVLEALVLLATAALDGYIREEHLRQEIARLRIEIDESRRARQVAEITDTNYFKHLQDRARQLRAKDGKD